MFNLRQKTLTKQTFTYKSKFKIFEVRKDPVFSLEMETWSVDIVEGLFG